MGKTQLGGVRGDWLRDLYQLDDEGVEGVFIMCIINIYKYILCNMTRYTKRIRKRRQRTKKLKIIRKTKRYKIKRGGTGPNDHENIGITDRWSFTNETDLENFKIYIFGSIERYDLWIQIMKACKDKENTDTETDKILFYILTSGNKVIIIRILQLLKIDDLVEEVLCVNANITANPINRNSNRDTFKGKCKYHVIQEIIKELYSITICPRRVTGAFIDDDINNEHNSQFCSTIEFIHATGDNVPTLNSENPYRLLCQEISPDYADKIYVSPHIVTPDILDGLLQNIQGSYTSCVFADFDRTVSPYNGVLPFDNQTFKINFFERFPVTVSPMILTPAGQ